MNNKVRFLIFCLCAGGLTACATNESNYHSFQSYYTSYQPYRYQDTRFDDYSGYSQTTATVPDSYYTGPLHSPTSHKDMDRNWVNSQNPKAYTIQIGESEKA